MKTAQDVLKELRESDAPTPTPRIILVDDEPVVLDVLAGMLDGYGYEVRAFELGEPALAAVAEGETHLVITDKNLPDIPGLELVRRGRTLSPDTEFLLVTGYASLESAIEAMDLGAYGYITKPFRDVNLVRARVEGALARNTAVHHNRLLIERLERSYADLFRAKVENEMLGDVAKETLKKREGEIRSILEGVLKPLGAAEADLGKIVEYFENIASSEDDRQVRVLLGRAKMLQGLVTISQQRVSELSDDLSDDSAA